MRFPNGRFETEEEFQKWFLKNCEDPIGESIYFPEEGTRRHNTKGPAYISKYLNLWWVINGNYISEFDGLWYEDLSEAQLKKLEFYKLKYNK